MNQSDCKFLIYRTDEKNITVNALIKDETIWISQKSMAQLFGCSVDNISLHLKNIYDQGELSADATSEDFSIVQQEGQMKYLNNHHGIQSKLMDGTDVTFRPYPKSEGSPAVEIRICFETIIRKIHFVQR